ncbi:DNA-3-methyladenine glycosylase [Niallia oryzisoli]|uniref:DNA-3-methyladenine glycosylase II n=1 Tax=Niallia oryzisoli TaxID=1737571 RepID=A0ABZ2CDF1_9BACI
MQNQFLDPAIKWEENGESLKIYTPKEFSFRQNLKYLSRSPNECLFEATEDKIIRALSLHNETVLIEITAENDTMLVVRFLADTASREKEAVVKYVYEWFDLGTDIRPFYDLAKRDPILHNFVHHFFGLRIMGIPDLFEALAWGIMGQQINLAFAYTLKRRLVEKFGTFVEHDGRKYWLFPKPEAIAHLQIKDLTELKMTGRKSEYLLNAAKLLLHDELSKEQLLQTNNVKEVEKILTKIRGIGPWTANYVLMRCLRFPNAFPIDDVGLHNSLKLALERDEKPVKEEILSFSEGWAEWKSYATFYLWRLLY